MQMQSREVSFSHSPGLRFEDSATTRRRGCAISSDPVTSPVELIIFSRQSPCMKYMSRQTVRYDVQPASSSWRAARVA